MEQFTPGLYLVATPIGNMDEISFRALAILKFSKYLFCEDTRELKKILSHFEIKTGEKNIVSIHEHNEKQKTNIVLQLINDGNVVVYTSDAGMPGISDPGSKLVDEILNAKLKVSVISGPSSVVNAVALSGFTTNEFTFFGFFPRTTKQQNLVIENIKNSVHTCVLFESPKRIGSTFKQLADEIPERRAVLCRELTKKFEEVSRDKLSELTKKYSNETKGECVIVIEGANNRDGEDHSFEHLIKPIEILKKNDVSLKDSLELLSSFSDLPRNEIKKIYLDPNT